MPIKNSAKSAWSITKQTFSEFIEDKCPRLGAALAYYTIFSIAPLLIIATGIAGIFFNKTESGQARIQAAVTQYAGRQAESALSDVLKTGGFHGGIMATTIGVVVLLFGAAGVFTELQDSLNTIWGVTPKPGRGIMGLIRDRFLSFTMVGGILFLLLASLAVTTILEAAGSWLTAHAGPVMKYVVIVLNLIVAYGVITLLFAMIYKILPDVKMAWRDVWVGACVTSLLFVVGKFALGLYLGHASIGSVYGAAGSLLVLLTWIYYSAQIFLVGAEFVQVWVKERGSQFVPDENAIPLTKSARAAQGIPKAAELQAAAVRSGKTVTAEQMPEGLVGTDMDARRELKRRQREMAAVKQPSRLLPATMGFAVGFIGGRLGKKNVPKMVLSGPVRLIRRKNAPVNSPRGNNEWAEVLHRLTRGWRKGVDNAK